MTVTHGDVAGADPAGVKALAGFVLRHGGFATAVVENIGIAGVRIVLIGEDGRWGDYVAASMEQARALCAAAKIDVADGWSKELAAAMPYTRPGAK